MKKLQKLKKLVELNDEAQIASLFYFVLIICFFGVMHIILGGGMYYFTEAEMQLAESGLPQTYDHIQQMLSIQNIYKALPLYAVFLALIALIAGSLRENSGYE